MPVCKNDSTRHYKGNEPSPKGLGFCAHAEKEGTIKDGLNKNSWIVSKGRWVKYVNTEHKLEKKLDEWWQTLATGNIIVVYNDNKYKKVKLSPAKWVDIANDVHVVAIIASGMSRDFIQFFIKHLIEKESKKNIDSILKTKNLDAYFAKNYKRLTYQVTIYSSKDMILMR